MRWVWQGIFAIEVPEGWHVQETGDLIEITPSRPVGAAHISVLKRKRIGPVVEGEASELVSSFAKKQGAELADLSEEASDSHWSASAEFETADREGALCWDVQAHVWDQRALVCSFCHDGLDDEIRRSALEMFRSIEPVMAGQDHSIH